MKLISLSVLLSVSILCRAQSPVYCVYLFSGDVTIRSGNTTAEKIKQNQFLFSNQLLKIGSNAQVTLVSKDARYIVLKTAGEFNTNDLGKILNNNPPGVTKKYLGLLWDQLSAPDNNYSVFKKKNAGGVSAGVERGDEWENLIFPVVNLRSSQDSIAFKWYQTGSTVEYIFSIYDDQLTELLKINVKDTQQLLNLKDLLKGKTGNYFWNVKSTDAQGCEHDPIPFTLVSKEGEEDAVRPLLALLPSNDLFGQLDIIDKLEQNKWIYRASGYYAKLVQENPDNVFLCKSYIVFLLKYGFEKEADMISKGIKF